MKFVFGIILFILNGFILSILIKCLKEAVSEAKECKNKCKFILTLIFFGGDAWDLLTLEFLTFMFGLICLLK